jgi:mono/diheme cytochrome c family protein
VSKGSRKRQRNQSTSGGQSGSQKKTGQQAAAQSPQASRKRSRLRIVLWVVGALAAVFILIQFIPYGRDHTNPPATDPFVWSAPGAEAVAKASCYDCHSNETRWWWAVDVAPFSWLAWRDIKEGRGRLNFSEWNNGVTVEELQRAVNGEMPPLQYTLLHPKAKLNDQTRQTLLNGFRTSLADQNAGSGSATPTPAPTSSAAGGAAVALINERCGTCHSPDQALQFRTGSADQAKALIDAMVQRGANVDAAEEQTLIDYFTR